MIATKLKGQITRDRRLVVKIPRNMATGAVEVIVLHLSSNPPSVARVVALRIPRSAFGQSVPTLPIPLYLRRSYANAWRCEPMKGKSVNLTLARYFPLKSWRVDESPWT